MALAWVDYAIQLGWGRRAASCTCFIDGAPDLEGRERDTCGSIRKTRFGGSLSGSSASRARRAPLVSRRYAGGRGSGLPGARFRPLGCGVNVETDIQEIVGPPGVHRHRRVPAVSAEHGIPNLTPTTTPDSCLSDTEARSSSRWGPVRDGPGADRANLSGRGDEPDQRAFAALSPEGPWKSLGIKYCPESCDFDLSGPVSFGKVRPIVDKDYDYNCTRPGETICEVLLYGRGGHRCG